jgi:hypothetical protein
LTSGKKKLTTSRIVSSFQTQSGGVGQQTSGPALARVPFNTIVETWRDQPATGA